MKFILVSIGCLMLLLPLGCSTSRCRCCGNPPEVPAGGRSTYDPVRDETTLEKDGFTWRIKGNATNWVVRPVPTK